MAMRKVVVFLVMTVAVWEACNGLCALDVHGLLACKDAVFGANPTDPSSGCCNKVKDLTKEDIKCICDYKTNQLPLLHTLGIDPERSIQLPKLCGLSLTIDC